MNSPKSNKFKVGDKVKVISHKNTVKRFGGDSDDLAEIGTEGIVNNVTGVCVGIEGNMWLLDVDDVILLDKTEYRDNTFGIDIICHYDNWDLGDYDLRPYRIAGEIDSMLDKTHLTGIGELEFVSAVPYIYDEEFAGLSLTYLAIRGNEDKVNPLV